MVLICFDSFLIIPRTSGEFSILNPLEKNTGTHHPIFDYLIILGVNERFRWRFEIKIDNLMLHLT